jgi:hypothetical protein
LEFERTVAPHPSAARAASARKPVLHSAAPSIEPMQRALDGWYREQPNAFARDPDPAPDPDATLARHHLLAQRRLAGTLDSGNSSAMDMAASTELSTVVKLRSTALEQLVHMNEVVLRNDPQMYPQLVAEAEALTSKLGLEPYRERAMFDAIRKRYAAAARPSDGDPAILKAKQSGA